MTTIFIKPPKRIKHCVVREPKDPAYLVRGKVVGDLKKVAVLKVVDAPVPKTQAPKPKSKSKK